jgi:thiamine biosynthesis lipoprotein
MGSIASLMLAGAHTEAQLRVAERRAGEVLAELESRFSSFRSESELSRFSAGMVDQPSEQLRAALAACAWLSEVSGGVFTTTTHEHDLAGYVKGWAVDQAAGAIAKEGVTDFALGVGGDWQAVGSGPQGSPWRFGIVDPSDTTRVRVVAEVTGGIATSGLYERGPHLRHTSEAAIESSAASFTVVGPRLTWADAFATIGFLLGDRGLGWVAEFPGYSAAIIRTDGSMVAHEDFPLVAGSAPPWPALSTLRGLGFHSWTPRTRKSFSDPPARTYPMAVATPATSTSPPTGFSEPCSVLPLPTSSPARACVPGATLI